MNIAYLCIFLSGVAMATTPQSIKVLQNPESMENFEHQFKGCPENSQCDQVMGMQVQRWKDLISKVRSESVSSAKKTQYLELFRSKFGIPAEFYTDSKSQTTFRPLYFNSPCQAHNPKPPAPKIYKAIAFIKELTSTKAKIWRDQTDYEVPTSASFTPQPVLIYDGPNVTEYALPIEDQPLFIKNKELHVLKEEDGFFYLLRASVQGTWKIVDIDMTKLSDLEDKRQRVACPVDHNFKRPAAFGVEFCKTIWDDDQKKVLIARMHRGCVI